MKPNNQEITTIWKQYKEALEGFINSKISDEDLAKDILQDVFLKLLQAYKNEMGIRNMQQWLFQVTRNTINDHFRNHFKVEKVELEVLEFEIENLVQGCVCDLSGYIIKNYLPDFYGKPLFLSDIEKIPQAEIAKMLDVSISGAKSRIQRGRKMLKDLIMKCVDIQYNKKGEVVNYQLKPTCILPQDLEDEIKKYKIST